MKSTFGKNLKITIWGGSHEPEIGVKIEGFPIGTEIDMSELRRFMKRRAPGNNPYATKRREADEPLPVSGLVPKGKSSGFATSTAGHDPEAAADRHAAAMTPEDAACAHADDDSIGTPGTAAGQPRRKSQGNAAPRDTARNDFASPEDSQDKAVKIQDVPVPEILVTDSPEISFRIINKDRRSADYSRLRSVPRPGHADYTARLRYGDKLNMAGGGPFSARMTAPLCIAGGIALQILTKQGIMIGGHILSIADARDDAFSPTDIDPQLLVRLRGESMPVISSAARVSMERRLRDAKGKLDSLGGIIEVCALGLPGGIGGAMYSGVESVLAPIFFGIPAVKGVEFGAGFHSAKLTGSVNNDAFYYDEDGNVKTKTNHHGGILGGITTGMPLIARVALKPTPSIGIEQDSVDLDRKENTKLTVTGRHDPCVAVRAVPVVEAAVALGLLDCIYDGGII